MQNCQAPAGTTHTHTHTSVSVTCQSYSKTCGLQLVPCICNMQVKFPPPVTDASFTPTAEQTTFHSHPVSDGNVMGSVAIIQHQRGQEIWLETSLLRSTVPWHPALSSLLLTLALTIRLLTHSSSRITLSPFSMMYMICSLLLLVLAPCFIILTAFHEQESCCNFCQESPPPLHIHTHV